MSNWKDILTVLLFPDRHIRINVKFTLCRKNQTQTWYPLSQGESKSVFTLSFGITLSKRMKFIKKFYFKVIDRSEVIFRFC